MLTSGLTHTPGIAWPHLDGTLDGAPFRYSCEVPHVARDLIAECASTDTFYRLPFAPDTTWHMGQGNNGAPDDDGDPDADSGCDCTAAPGSGDAGWWATCLAVGAIGARRRRRD